MKFKVEIKQIQPPNEYGIQNYIIFMLNNFNSGVDTISFFNSFLFNNELIVYLYQKSIEIMPYSGKSYYTNKENIYQIYKKLYLEESDDNRNINLSIKVRKYL